MSEILELILGGLLEFVLSPLLEVIDWAAVWRLLLCLALAGGAVVLIYHATPRRGLRLAASIPTAIVGVGSGLLWERRSR